ncbi:DUF4440 domain-containing protein [Serinibacter arcticus]|uniref:DUF4440 domain-containing protein n=1 Tax=Serinibacter arcticus TaxID=1655435 RepID=A0A2U1ZVH3_9MICO|nr:nuclear transport factor 2 family protein [Serinibacter arcticus]PWD50986.1 DUF4440 domain-containing protein [Serinibacter arcticus]
MTGTTHADPTEAIADIARSYGERAAALDAAAFIALYDDGIVVHDLFSPEPIVGIDVWRAQVDHWFGDVTSEDTNVARIGPLTIHASGDLATAFGRVRYGILGQDGTERYGMWNRLTWVLRRDGDAWRIVHEHTSVSLDAESGQPVLG